MFIILYILIWDLCGVKHFNSKTVFFRIFIAITLLVPHYTSNTLMAYLTKIIRLLIIFLKMNILSKFIVNKNSIVSR